MRGEGIHGGRGDAGGGRKHRGIDVKYLIWSWNRESGVFVHIQNSLFPGEGNHPKSCAAVASQGVAGSRCLSERRAICQVRNRRPTEKWKKILQIMIFCIFFQHTPVSGVEISEGETESPKPRMELIGNANNVLK